MAGGPANSLRPACRAWRRRMPGKTRETQAPCPGLRGFCISALTVYPYPVPGCCCHAERFDQGPSAGYGYGKGAETETSKARGIRPGSGDRFFMVFGRFSASWGHGNGPGSLYSVGCTKNQPRRLILKPIRGQFVFLGPLRPGQGP
jgi:hypothetical protein